MNGSTANIAILSDQKVRANIIKDLISNGMNHSVFVSVIGSNEFNHFKSIDDELIVIVDLISLEKPARQLLKEIRSTHPKVQIIALHIYRSPALVQPLYEMGINGYIYYEPSRKELVEAIRSVSNGNRYTPEYLIPS
jgi:DNA-binding NarL/FixJ family response regulator